MQQVVSSLQLWTVAVVLFVLAMAFIIGLGLRALVRKTSLHPSLALRVIQIIAVVVGGGFAGLIGAYEFHKAMAFGRRRLLVWHQETSEQK